MNKQKTSKRRIGMNIGLAFLSLFCALALWAYVTVIEDPTRERVITINMPVIYGMDKGLFAANDLVLLDQGSTVNLTFTGRQSDLNKLNKNNVSIEIDVSSIAQAGEHQRSYEVILPESVVGRVYYTFDQAYVKVNVDKMLTRAIKVELHGEVNPAENYTLRQPEKTPEYINVRGPQSVVNQIVEAGVDVVITEPLDKTASMDMPYLLNDAEGKSVSMEHIDTGNVDTVHVVYSVYLRKEVPLALSFVDGGGLTEEKNINYQIEPAAITIVGDPEQVETINQIYLGQSILLENLLSNIDESYPVILPNGITSESGEINAHVKVTIHGIETKQLTVSGRIRGFNEDGYRVELINPYIDITLRGSPEAISKINSSMINAYVDLTGVNIALNSLFDYPLVVDIGNLTDVGVIGGPYNVTVRKVAVTDADEDEP